MRRCDGLSGVCSAGLVLVGTVCGYAIAEEEPPNLTEGATATESSVWNVDSPGFEAIDGRVENDGRWVSSNIPGPHTLVLDLPEPREVGSYHMWMGIEEPRANGDQFPVRNFELQWLDGETWRTIPGSEVVANEEAELAIAFDAPVTASSFRLFLADNGFVRVREILLFEPLEGGGTPELGVGIFEPSDLPDPTAHPILLNQIGYDTGGAKRFTAPLTMDGSAFEVVEAGSQQVVFSGVVNGNVGDFSAFEPAVDDLEYVVRVSGLRSDGEPFDDGESHPFEIGRMLMLRRLMAPALGFNIDARSVVSTHPSSSGGGAWRDGSWFTHEMPSLAMQYMAHPGYYESAVGEIDLQAENAYVLAPGFTTEPSFNDEEIPGTAQTYHQTYVNSLDDSASDLAKMLHWTAGMILVDPVIEVFNNPVEGQIYNQTVEQMAFFLRVYPELPSGDIDIAFYEEARDQTVQWWSDVGLFDLVTFVGDEKGEDAPGHSIMPNLLMHEVAVRDGLPEAQAFLDAAVAQTDWLISTYDPTDKSIAKGQRVSEHKFYTGLAMLLSEYPEAAPAGLAAWLDAWIDNAVSLSDNMYDFRKYDEVQWTLPEPWNEPGNIAACPGILSAIEGAGIDGLGDHAGRLAQMRASHLDNLFGRNPVGAATSGIPGSDFPGVDTWWPRIYTGPYGWLDLCRGVINSCAATEHYPYEFRSAYRHAEGWVAHNSGLNVSLAYLSRDAISLDLLDAAGEPVQDNGSGLVPPVEFRVRLRAPFEPGMVGALVPVRIVVDGVEHEVNATVDSVTSATTGLVHRGAVGLNEPGVDAELAYGIGFLASETPIAGACGADLAPPAGVLDLADINAFVTGFTGATGASDLNGDGVYDLGDIGLFVGVFVGGCG
jgi:hypothetical protein